MAPALIFLILEQTPFIMWIVIVKGVYKIGPSLKNSGNFTAFIRKAVLGTDSREFRHS